MEIRAAILVVDDDPLVQMNYLDILSEAGFDVTGAGSLAQARRELAGGRRFDLLVCDHDLGDGKGLDLVVQLTSLSNPPPVIYLSAALPDVLAQAAALAPVKKVLSKPVEPAYLLDVVRQFTAELAPVPESSYPSVISREERNLLLRIFN